HNAKKAGSGVVNIVGEHATYHIALDAPLTSDIEGLARPMSDWVHTSTEASAIGGAGAMAVQAAMTPPGVVATLILPGDTAWNEGGVVAEKLSAPTRASVDPDAVDRAAAALGPETLLLLGGEALNEQNVNLAGRIAAKTGCGLRTEWSNARLMRGAGRVSVDRIPYVVELALKVLAPYKRIILMGAERPIAFFAYPDKPSILTADDVEFFEVAAAADDIDGAMEALADAAGALTTPPQGMVEANAPDLPSGPPTPDGIAAVLANMIPENGIVADESVTTGRSFFATTLGAKPHDWLNNRGGSIGYSLPVAIGAAIACPDRKVIAQAGDGSAMYTIQALWTMARENLDIAVVIFANRAYRILQGELKNVGVQNPGPRAVDMLSIAQPELNFVDMAKGMGVDGQRVETLEDFAKAMEAGLAVDGPYLIELMM
ncbi:MAG: acetolactate synthase large subunit, partial [Pseudomonadota bacterium]